MFGKSSLIIVCCMAPLLFIGVDYALGYGCDCTNTTPTCEVIKTCPEEFLGWRYWCSDTTPRQVCIGTPSFWDPDCTYEPAHWCKPAMKQYCSYGQWGGDPIDLEANCADYGATVRWVTQCKW